MFGLFRKKHSTRRADGSPGAEMLNVEYVAVREAILDLLLEHGPMSLQDVIAGVEKRVRIKLTEPVPWYCLHIRLELEFEGLVKYDHVGHKLIPTG
jgi:hypothetical protein